MKTILIIDDDEQLVQIMTMYLQKNGYQVYWAEDGVTGGQLCQKLKPNLIILDVMLPGIDGFKLCTHLRCNKCCAPILMISAKSDVTDRINGIELGADDYLCKPFSMNEMVVRVKALLRRWEGIEEKVAIKPRLYIDYDKRKIFLKDKELDLTNTEYLIMVLFLKNQGKIFSRDELMSNLRGIDHLHLTERAIDFHITNLRKKIEKSPKNPTYIKTIWGMGYQFQQTEDEDNECEP
ncbi:response regulator transcription factor [Desulfuribacillus alkaliarsenatis]|uniref:DNA-binding response regulator n=1 Tax=Desulfuribacillus alkaliarsenatis TaxID=766136 RepID=A0A1E5G4L5_9FIRM|nr:response regulator transcription factor [Desulfuribacillus alkaliarsenatis]OEF98120.1 hypothetical protein BHF68_00050 [Desulfuribacillus alkaliarsenatis]